MSKQRVETTIFSLSDEAPVCPDRRAADRYVSLLRVGAITADGRRELCLIRNVSAGGMMIRPYSPIAAGTRLSVELKHGEAVSGSVQWSANGLIGVAFETAIDVLSLLRASATGPRPRMPRIEIDCTALLRCDGQVSKVDVVNISQGGICIGSTRALAVDADVVVSLPGLHSAAGVMRWKDGDQYGVGFNRVYPVDELMRFLQSQQREQQEPRRRTG